MRRTGLDSDKKRKELVDFLDNSKFEKSYKVMQIVHPKLIQKWVDGEKVVDICFSQKIPKIAIILDGKRSGGVGTRSPN
ncbi:hypothetical protein [Phormidium sp. CCY1219]|uniref:hypothetical protein n=1 Tax=Phormidium sp. CCY1219 TaxID=2886104 RepID=UPI002D1ECD32|nr:hypothetical protein [Phormidium sp. CCY1219]MEB3831611.1 hypothetical protein [Phormidium sp. CCY1219]